MRYNKKFAKSENKTELVFAPGEFDFGGVHYNAANDEIIYNEMGYLRYIRSEMPVKPGFYLSRIMKKRENVFIRDGRNMNLKTILRKRNPWNMPLRQKFFLERRILNERNR